MEMRSNFGSFSALLLLMVVARFETSIAQEEAGMTGNSTITSSVLHAAVAAVNGLVLIDCTDSVFAGRSSMHCVVMHTAVSVA